MNRGQLSRSSRSSSSAAGFSLLELLFVLAALALLAVTAFPHQNVGPRTERLICANNLRQIGVAFQEWSSSFDDKLPWLVRVENGGTAGNSLMNNAWYHFLTLSNQLSSPSLLACPSDNARPARNWGTGADGGFLNPSFRANALSYFVGGHSEIRLPRSLLSADRNIRPDQINTSCSVGFTSVILINVSSPSTQGRWTGTNVHLSVGNLLFTDGTVLAATSAELMRYGRNENIDTGTEHILLPR